MSEDLIKRSDAIEAVENNSYGMGRRASVKAIKALSPPKTEECTGCKFIGLYDTEFPCANCVRKTKDYYCGARMEGGDDE